MNHGDELLKLERFQNDSIENARINCANIYGVQSLNINSEQIFDNTTGKWMCPPFFDLITCWPPTEVNKTAILECPEYIIGFLKNKTATKQCLEDGSWYNWTNYNDCSTGDNTLVRVDINVKLQRDFKDYVPTIKMISRTGYTISFFTLVLAFVIMFSIKKLHCARNKLHMHLFASFIMRAGMFLLKDLMFKNGIGLNSDTMTWNGDEYFVQDRNWSCKLFTSLFNFFITANYSWILMEGLYLYNLIFRSMFADSNKKITPYIILGWGMPFLVISVWIGTRLMLADTYCWTTNDDVVLPFLIIRIPTAMSILVNMILFVRIAVVIYSKLQAPNQEDARSYRKWARSTLVLAPLFGIHYALLIGMSSSINLNQTVEIIWLFADQLFASSQGFVVAILYCFLNSEVRSELKPHAHAFLVFIASHNCLRYFFPCRERYLRSERGRTSVCTTMSCSSLFNNGLNHRNSRTGLPRGVDFGHHGGPRTKNDRTKEHVCRPHASRYVQDDTQARLARAATRQLFANGNVHNERLGRLNEDTVNETESFAMLPSQSHTADRTDSCQQCGNERNPPDVISMPD